MTIIIFIVAGMPPLGWLLFRLCRSIDLGT